MESLILGIALIIVYSCSLNESGKIRRTVQLGIEKIRAVDQRHGLQAQLLIYLANAFGSKVSGSIIIQCTLGFCHCHHSNCHFWHNDREEISSMLFCSDLSVKRV